MGVPPDQIEEDCYHYEVTKDYNNVIELCSDNEDEAIEMADKNGKKDDNVENDRNSPTDKNANNIEEISKDRSNDAEISAFIDLDSGNEDDTPSPVRKRFVL